LSIACSAPEKPLTSSTLPAMAGEPNTAPPVAKRQRWAPLCRSAACTIAALPLAR